MSKQHGDLVTLFQQMYEHTKDECARCRAPHSCCALEACAMADDYARSCGIILERTDHPKLPFMGPEGCTVPPHLRPLCTMHTCAINSLGFKPNDPEWTERYFNLRSQIEEQLL